MMSNHGMVKSSFWWESQLEVWWFSTVLSSKTKRVSDDTTIGHQIPCAGKVNVTEEMANSTLWSEKSCHHPLLPVLASCERKSSPTIKEGGGKRLK